MASSETVVRKEFIDEDFLHSFCVLAFEVRDNSKAHGFWEDGQKRNKGEMIALMHSELSEALEGVRKPDLSDHIPAFTLEEEEMADCIIRIMDYAAGWNLRVAQAVLAKMAFNRTRPYKHGKTC